jgi:hypothetical protein
MTGVTDHERYKDWDASYVLGALPTDERLEYERHLAECPICREAVGELAGIPGILGRLAAEDAVAIAGPAEAAPVIAGPPLQVVARRARLRRRRGRVVIGFAAAAAIAGAVGIGSVVGASGGFGPHSTPQSTSAAGTSYAMRSVGGVVGMTADLEVTPTAWGTRFDWSCRYHAPTADDTDGTSLKYDLVVTKQDGSTETVATWGGKGEAGANASGLAAATGIPLSSITSVVIRLHGQTKALLETSLQS